MNEQTIEDVQAELKRLKAAAAERQSAKELDDLRAEVQLETFKATAEEHFARVVKSEGRNNVRLVLSDPDVGYVILKTPAQVTLKKFSAQAENITHESLEDLIRPSLLYPSKDDFDVMVSKKPGLVITCSNEVLALAGIQTKALGGK